MSSDTYDRATVGNNPEHGRVRGMIDTLQNLRQNVETVVRQSRFEIGGSGVDQIDAPSELDEYVEKAREVGFIWKGIEIFANDVWEPGYRIEGPDVTKAYLLGEGEDIDATPPEDTPDGGFLKNSALYAGEKHQDFYDYGKVCTRQRWLRGTVLTELLKADPEDPESEITGFYFIRPETVSAEVYPNSNILIDPEDTEQPGVELTRRGEAAAYIQFDDQSILGRRGRFQDDDTDEIPLSQNDVQKQVLSPGIGDDEASEQGIFGTSVIEPISQDIAEYQQMKRDRSTAIGNKSHGIWLIEHGRDVVDLGDERRLYEWDSESMDDFESMLSNVEPGGYVTHDGSVTPERVEGDVPDIQDVIDHYVEAIISALPTPKYKIGFEDDINRDVTGEQNSDYDRFVSEEREYQERQWTKTIREVCERKGLPTEGLRLRIEPEPDDSPVMSLSVEEMDKLATYADALNSLAGPTGGPQTLVDTETLLTKVAQLPESVNAVEELPDPEDTQNQDAMSEFMDILEADTDTYASFSEGDEVDTPAGVGVVVEIRTEGFEGPDGDDVEASEDEPAYVVAVEEGAKVYRASDLSDGEIQVEGVDTPEDTLNAWVDIADATEGMETLQDDGRRFDYPESWQESPTPNRIILLKAWAGLGGRFTTCRREMAGEVASPSRFCASMKDRVLNWEGWRQ